MLAARHREDDRRPGPHRAIERIVGGGVAGVEADDEVDARERLVAGDVADLETEAVGPERSCQRLAVSDDLGLEVEPDDLDLAAVHDREQMMQRERQIRLARAEVDDPQRAGGERRKHVLDELEKAIDLPELVVPPASYLSLRGHHPELDEERHRHALGQEAALDPVVCEGGGGPTRRPAEDPRLLPGGEHLPVGVGRLEQALPELRSRAGGRAARRRHPGRGSRPSTGSPDGTVKR